LHHCNRSTLTIQLKRPGEKEGAMPIADDEGVIATAALTTPLLQPTAVARDPFVEVRLYRRGAGPVALFRSRLAGPRRDRLDVRRIQAEHGLRALFAFKPGDSRRGLQIRHDPVAGYSALPFRNGAVIVLDGEPKVCLGLPVFAVYPLRFVDIPERLVLLVAFV
jgi:hypothetical protein